jgi:hypothetical protein
MTLPNKPDAANPAMALCLKSWRAATLDGMCSIAEAMTFKNRGERRVVQAHQTTWRRNYLRRRKLKTNRNKPPSSNIPVPGSAAGATVRPTSSSAFADTLASAKNPIVLATTEVVFFMLFPSIFNPRPSWLLTQHQSRTSFP